MKILRDILIQPKSLILIFIVTVLVAVSSAFIELNQSKSEMLELMVSQGHSILETVLTASKNAVTSYNTIEKETKQRLLNNAQTIKLLDEKKMLSRALLEKFAIDNNILRINIFNKSGDKILSSHRDEHQMTQERESPKKFIAPILNGQADTLIIGLKSARFLDEMRFAVALATRDRKVIVLNVNATDMLKFRSEIGIGPLLKKVTENPQIIYAALQDSNSIIAGSGKLDGMENINSSPLLTESLKDNQYKWRIHSIGESDVFEVVHPFIQNGKTIGLFRLGISLAPMNEINNRLTRRIIAISIILLLFGFITLTLIFVRQNFGILSKKFKIIESYSSRIVDNVSDGILVLNPSKNILLINKAAQVILNVMEPEVQGKPFSTVFPSQTCDLLWSSSRNTLEIECELKRGTRLFLFSKSEFIDEQTGTHHILVFRDLTEQKLEEMQTARNEKMIAMGELASSVAHEIRNPLNSIGTIAQQIGKDFRVNENEDEFNGLTRIVYSEVRRINDTIESFLKFARPLQVKAEVFSLKEFFSELSSQYSQLCSVKHIELSVECSYLGDALLDRSQLKQVFINLLENSIDALPEGGVISASALVKNNSLNVIFSDTGIGIEPDKIDKIFGLYFTSKKKGNGIGLSIVNKIISEHGGTITVRSRVNGGTEFRITLPLQFS